MHNLKSFTSVWHFLQSLVVAMHSCRQKKITLKPNKLYQTSMQCLLPSVIVNLNILLTYSYTQSKQNEFPSRLYVATRVQHCRVATHSLSDKTIKTFVHLLSNHPSCNHQSDLPYIFIGIDGKHSLLNKNFANWFRKDQNLR